MAISGPNYYLKKKTETGIFFCFRSPLIIQHSLIGSKENWKTVSKVSALETWIMDESIIVMVKSSLII